MARRPNRVLRKALRGTAARKRGRQLDQVLAEVADGWLRPQPDRGEKSDQAIEDDQPASHPDEPGS